MSRDYYEILGVARDADDKKIKAAYRKLAKKYHPDTNPDNRTAEQKFKEITEAYEVLSDPEKKKLYDQYGTAAFDGSMGQGPGKGAQAYGWSDFQNGTGRTWTGSFTSGQDMDDILKHIFGELHGAGAGGFGGGFSDAFRGDFGNGSFGGRQADPGGGRDVHADLQVSFEDAALGCDKVLMLSEEGGRRLQVHIPAGIDEGQSIRLKGQGIAGRNGEKGDLFVCIHIRQHPEYERKGQDLYMTASIPYTTAVLGGKAMIDTLYGRVECTIPAGTRCGSTIRLRNKGIVSMKNRKVHGDLYIRIQIDSPQHISEEERKATARLAEIQQGLRRSA